MLSAAKHLSRWAARCFAEFPLSAAHGLSMTRPALVVTLHYRPLVDIPVSAVFCYSGYCNFQHHSGSRRTACVVFGVEDHDPLLHSTFKGGMVSHAGCKGSTAIPCYA